MTTIDGLAPLAERWDALLALQDRPDPLRRASWLTAWWRAFGAPRRRRADRVLLAMSGDHLVGAAPLMLERFPGGAVVLRHLGNSSHWFDPDLLADPAVPEARMELARAIAGIPCDLVALEDLAEGSPSLDALAAAMPGLRVLPQGQIRHRYRALDPPPLGPRRKDTRNRVRAAERAGRTVTIALDDDPAVIVTALDEAFDLTERVWRPRGDASEVTHAAGRRYVREGVSALRPGQALLTRVRADGRLVAFDLALRDGPSAVMFRGNWDPASGVSGAGWMSMLAALDNLVEAGALEVDFGKFDWPYKRVLASVPAVRLATAALPRGARGAAGLGLWRARPALLGARARMHAGAVRGRDTAARLRPRGFRAGGATG